MFKKKAAFKIDRNQLIFIYIDKLEIYSQKSFNVKFCNNRNVIVEVIYKPYAFPF